LDFKQLESFVTIAKLKSFSKSADKLYLTQPTISNHIHLLEKELGTILFNRTNKNITLTRAGDILYEYAISILNKKDHAYFSLNEFKGKIEGTLEISSSSIPELYFLTDAICRFNVKYPDVKYSLMKYDTRQVIDKIISGDIDFGIVGAKKDIKQLEYIEIMGDDIALITPAKGALSNISNFATANCLETPLILREDGSGTRSSVLQYLTERGIDTDALNIIAEVESNETIKKLVELGLGISFLSKRSIEKEVNEGLIKCLPINNEFISRKFYFVYHKKRVLSPLSETFKDFILSDKA
jgi:DNA-binding transcriptional LysR family regulator